LLISWVLGAVISVVVYGMGRWKSKMYTSGRHAPVIEAE